MSENKRKLIVGLGNVGNEYDNTRHNTGFALLSWFATQYNATFSQKTKFKGLLCEVSLPDATLILLKPTTFYNLSGEAVRAVCDFYKLKPQDVLVVHDELALPFGTVRTRLDGSDAGNNGIKSIQQHIGENFARLRVGIWNDLRDRMPDADFVLSKFSAAEAEKLQKEIVPKAGELIEQFSREHFPHDTHTV